jgi:uncharacterized protein (TIGR02271 family)
MREPATHSTASEAPGAGPSGKEYYGKQQETLTSPNKIELERLIDYEVLDKLNENIGSVSAFWTDHTGKPAFIGVKTLWLVGKSHVVPAWGAEVNHARRHVRLPFTSETVKNAPSYDPDAELDPGKEREVYGYYQTKEPGMSSASYQAGEGAHRQGAGDYPSAQARTGEETRIPLHEEELKVGKRSVETGGVRLRKIVRSETVQQPVEVKREDVVIERVSAEKRAPGETSGKAFEGEEVYIPLWREEPVVSKEAHVTEELRARKTEERESETVSGEVRKEDVEVQDQRKEPRR